MILEFLGNDLRASCCKSGARLFSGQPKLRLCWIFEPCLVFGESSILQIYKIIFYVFWNNHHEVYEFEL